jgi:hypothetical protein
MSPFFPASINTAPYSTVSIPVPSPVTSAASTTPASRPVVVDPVLTVATAWARAWCGWSYRARYGARELAARDLMSPTGAAALTVTSATTWSTQVVAAHQTARCGPVTVTYRGFAGSAPAPTANVAYVLIHARRTVSDAHGVTSETFSEPRRMSKVGGRWLVDVLAEGG